MQQRKDLRQTQDQLQEVVRPSFHSITSQLTAKIACFSSVLLSHICDCFLSLALFSLSFPFFFPLFLFFSSFCLLLFCLCVSACLCSFEEKLAWSPIL